MKLALDTTGCSRGRDSALARHHGYTDAVMAKLVVNGAKLKCSQGMAPSVLTILPVSPANSDAQPGATVMDMKPTVNIAPFGMCQAQANPQVAAATAAAMGLLTPMPCLPVISAPWSPGAAIATIDENRALSSDSTCACSWAGTIEITDPACDVNVD
jgi:hypothetical protein